MWIWSLRFPNRLWKPTHQLLVRAEQKTKEADMMHILQSLPSRAGAGESEDGREDPCTAGTRSSRLDALSSHGKALPVNPGSGILPSGRTECGSRGIWCRDIRSGGVDVIPVLQGTAVDAEGKGPKVMPHKRPIWLWVKGRGRPAPPPPPSSSSWSDSRSQVSESKVEDPLYELS